jgi:ABC-type nickel/cobalt efflux system permease component RcnA
MTAISLILLGFMLGLRHAMEADHVAAVASLAAGRQSFLSVAGRAALWGCGHTLTLFFAAAMVLVAGVPFPAGAEWWLELVVALMLVVLGGDVIRRAIRDRIHVHTHAHVDGSVHWHAHRHIAAARETHAHGHGPIKPLVVGMVHGLAGSAALLLLVLDRVGGDSWVLGMGYVLMFGVGSIVGMTSLSLIIALPFRIGSPSQRWQTAVSAVTGLVTLSIGAWLLWELSPFEVV